MGLTLEFWGTFCLDVSRVNSLLPGSVSHMKSEECAVCWRREEAQIGSFYIKNNRIISAITK